MKIVPVDEIPKAELTPLEDLMSLYKVFQGMEQICEQEHGIGLAAVQVGIPWHLFIIRRPTGYEYFVNCRYEGSEQKTLSIEGCLSIRDDSGNLLRYVVNRHDKVKVFGKRLVVDDALSLVDVEIEADGLIGIVFQHEIDHGNGILISEVGEPAHVWGE